LAEELAKREGGSRSGCGRIKASAYYGSGGLKGEVQYSTGGMAKSIYCTPGGRNEEEICKRPINIAFHTIALQRVKQDQLKEQLVKERDDELEEVISRLESETNSNASDIHRQYRITIERIKADAAEEVKQVGLYET
jgi:hypothetical protein